MEQADAQPQAHIQDNIIISIPCFCDDKENHLIVESTPYGYTLVSCAVCHTSNEPKSDTLVQI